MKSIPKKLLLIFLAIASLNVVSLALSPPPPVEITGPSSVVVGVANTYYFTRQYVTAPVWSILSGSATINSTWSSGNTFYVSVTWATSGTLKYYDEIIEYSGTKAVTAVAAAPGSPTPTHGSRCGTGAVNLSASPGSSGDKVRWYTTLTGGTYVESLTFTTPSIASTTTYYIETWSSSSSLPSSPRTEITATINSRPNQPVSVTDGHGCGASVVISAVPASPANNIIWYSSPIKGDSVYIGLTYTTPSLVTATPYYAASYNTTTGCISAGRVSVMANVDEKPAPITSYQLTSAYGSGSVDLWAYLYSNPQDQPGGTYVEVGDVDIDTSRFQVSWYATQANALAGTARLARGVLFHTPTIPQATKFYMRVRDKLMNCLGDVTEANAIIIPLISSAKIQTDVIRVAGKKTESSLAALTPAEKSTVITYLDGVGRERQQVAVKGSQSGKDIIMPMEYDSWGRSSKNYLPYAGTTTDGSFHSAYVTEQFNFFQASNDKVANDNYPFAISIYEDTPDGRLIEQGGVGQAWQPGSNHTAKIKYSFNTGSTASEAEEVRKFNSDGSSSGFYAAKTLHRLETTDAMGNREIVFKSSDGKVIAKKTQLDKTTEGVMVNYIQTYYCYDDVGRIRYIIQPKGVVALKAASWVTSQTLRDQHMFQFSYDKRGRVVAKRVPGSDWEYIVYDQLNRPVLTQDANIRATNQWNFIKYDNKGRLIMTGLYTDAVNTTRVSLQNILDVKNYDAADKYFEIRQASTHGYSNLAFPTTNTQILTVSYYDDHDFNFDGAADFAYTPQADIVSETAASSSYGLATGSKMLIGGTSNWLTSYAFHDQFERVIQVRSNNHMNPSVIDNLSTTVYDFEKSTKSKTYHNAGGTNQVTIVNTPEYDNASRLKKIKQKLNTGAELLVAQYDYNELGQLVDKKLHGTGTPGSEVFLQSVDYRYTIQGQLLSINNAQLNTGTNNDELNDYFGLELLYDGTGMGNTARFDGNISGVKWKGPGSINGLTGQKGYKFIYDKSNKLESAISVVRGSSIWDQELNAQNEVMTYDLNGNLKTLQRNQRKHQLVGVIASYISEAADNLTYTYNSTNANRLEKITDAAPNTSGFNNGASSSSNDYTYDNDGNLKSDFNKGISNIVYNHLGKPTLVSFTDGRKIEYIYDATGNKLNMKTYSPSSALLTNTDYVGGFIYESNALSFFGSPEGRVVKNGSGLEYQYSIADHQGNTRVVFSSVTPAVNAPVATFEGDANDGSAQYINGGLNIVSFGSANHTTSGSKVVRMNQSNKIGPARSVKVYPGDKVDIEVWEYHESGSGYGTAGTALTNLITAVAGAFTGVVAPTEVGMMNTGVSNALTVFGTGGNQGDLRPAAYLNYILFDKNYNVLDAGWQLAPAATFTKQKISFPTKDIKETGYLYTWLSYDDASNNYVYFDDFKVTHTKSNIVQYNEYYPFGLQTSNSWTRDNNKNNYLYNAASELNKDNGWYETFFRGYDPAIGRFLQVDPLAASEQATYQYAGNNPVLFNDPNGDKISLANPQGASDRLAYLRDYASEWSQSSDMFFRHATQNEFEELLIQLTGGGTAPDGRIYDYNKNGVFGYWESFSGFDNSSYDNFDGLSGTTKLGTQIVGERFIEVTNGSGPGDPPAKGGDTGFRFPDFYTLNISIAIPNPITLTLVGWNGAATIDRHGQIFLSPFGVSVGKSATVASASLTGNWLLQSTKPTPNETYNFLSGHGISIGGGYIGGINWTISPTNDATKNALGLGLYTPQIGASYNYTPGWLIFNKK